MTSQLEIAAAVATTIAGVPVLYKLTSPVRAVGAKFKQMIEDWVGEPARPGVAARPGVMERFDDHDKRLDRLETLAKSTSVQVHNNGGESTRDAVGKILKATTGEDLTPVAPPEVDG